jgi:hypothetical protein
MKTRFEVIQYLINAYQLTSYLEIGVRYAIETNSISKNSINCAYKTGVDISNPAADYIMASDEFFSMIPIDQKYDIIFVDGDHEKHQVYKDIINSLNHLNDGGFIVCHDINPFAERQLHPTKCHNAWETWAMLRQTRTDLCMHALTIDMVGIITKGTQDLYTKDVEFSWKYLDDNRHELLNVITEDTFKQTYKK